VSDHSDVQPTDGEPRSSNGQAHSSGGEVRPAGGEPGGPADESGRGYLPLFGRIVLANLAVLLGACFVIYVIVTPARLSKLATDEALVVTLCLVTLVNLILVRRVVVPLQQLTLFARRVDPAQPGTRFPDAGAHSEAGELALTFNEMLERLEAERAQSARSVLGAHEGERLRVAQELHDEVGQTLTAVLLQLSRVHGRVDAELGPVLGEAQDAVRTSLEDVRRIATELRPETLAELGLVSALATLSENFSRRTGIAVSQELQPDLPALTEETELAVYRVAQEALTNVARHAGTDRTDLSLLDGTGQLTLVVRDYGCGLNGSPRDGNGIRGMRERAGAIGGSVRVGAPTQGPGSEVRLQVPLS